MDFDTVISKGNIIDGTGKPRFKADLGLRAGKIAALAEPGTLTSPHLIDASGLSVAPGFIDIHSHADWMLSLDHHEDILGPMVAQGITTVVAGNCGFSPAPVTDKSMQWVDDSSEMLRDRELSYAWRSMGEFLNYLESKGILMNAAFLAGHGTLRQAVMGKSSAVPAPDQLKNLSSLLRSSLREGAFGLSAGLAYAPGVFAKNEELLHLLHVNADEGGVFTVHGRAFSWVSPFYKPLILGEPHNLRSVKELLGIAAKSGSKIQLSHQIFIGRRTWPTYRRVLRTIEEAIGNGVDAAFDAFPYTVGNSTINAIFPDWVLDHFHDRIRDPGILRRLSREFAMFRLLLGFDYPDIRLLWGCNHPEFEPLEGLDFGSIAKALHKSPFDAYVHVARETDGKARILLGTYSGHGDEEEPLRAVLSHPMCCFETDTILTSRGKHNPASFGTFPRVLGRYSRDLGLFSLEEAVRRMTSLPAERIGLQKIGRIAPGYWGDLVVFDANTIADRTTPEHADAHPAGIAGVYISGELVANEKGLVKAGRKGRVLRR